MDPRNCAVEHAIYVSNSRVYTQNLVEFRKTIFLTPPVPPSPTLGHDPGDRKNIRPICYISFICAKTHKVWFKNL